LLLAWFLFITGDFIVLLFVSRQSIVFKIERRHIDVEYPGGTNRSIIEEAEKPSFINPVPDFVTHIRLILQHIKYLNNSNIYIIYIHI
jgi:hypothetical protein